MTLNLLSSLSIKFLLKRGNIMRHNAYTNRIRRMLLRCLIGLFIFYICHLFPIPQPIFGRNVVYAAANMKIKANSPLPSEYMKRRGLGFCEKNSIIGSPNPNIHNGIDISAPAGTPVFSLFAGKLVLDATNRDYWNSFLIVEHNFDGRKLYAYYGHVQKTIDNQNQNSIKAGSQIAVIRRDTGGRIGDHLHLSISFTDTWNKKYWGYNFTCDDAKKMGYQDSWKVLDFSFQPPTPIDNPPNVTSFSASASQITQGQSVTLSYSVVDDVGLKQVELWRADDTAGVGFREIKRVPISGKAYSGSISDTPSSPGTYRYGVHAVDTAGKWNDERNSQSGSSPGVYGPKQVVVAGVSPTVTNPNIASVSPTQVQAGQFTLTINGSNFDSGAIDQFYTPSGQLMGSGAQSGGLVSRSSNQIVVRENLTGAPAGTYTVRVKNSDGKLSGPINILVAATAPPTPVSQLSSAVVNAFNNLGGSSVFGSTLPPSYTTPSGAASTGTSFKAVELARGGIYEYSRGVFVVYGAIYTKYRSLGGPKHYLGLPITNEGDAVRSPKGTTGRYSQFERGTINWLREKNLTYLVQGAIFQKYASLGYSGSQLGFPLSDEYPYQSGAQSDFEGGSITWTSQAGAQVTYRR
jgi:hypothetical protein